MQMSVEYGDVIKAYQNKVSELINQLITAEAKLIACENIIQKYEQKTEELEKKVSKSSSRVSKKSNSSDVVVDYN